MEYTSLLRCSCLCVLLILTADSLPSQEPKPDVPSVPEVKDTANILPPAAAATTPVPRAVAETTAIPASNVSLPEVKAAPEVLKPLLATSRMGGVPGANLKAGLVVEPDSVRKDLGAKCASNTDCAALNNTYCHGNMCLCKPGFIPSKHSLDKCVKVPHGLGDVCEEQAQCEHAVPDSECRDSKCDCPPNFIFDQGRCWQKQLLGGVCSVTQQCREVEFSRCDQGVCSCEPPLLPSPNNKCLLAAKEYLESCVEDIQCDSSFGDEARCSNGQCRCMNDYHFNGSLCVPNKKLGDFCLSDEDCVMTEEQINKLAQSHSCQGSRCTCAPGYIALPGEEICSKTSPSSAEELAVSVSWLACVLLAKYYLV